MKQQTKKNLKRVRGMSAVSLGLWMAAGAVGVGIVQTGAGGRDSVMAQQAATSGTGLDALNDDRLMAELASRRLDSLLKRAFEVNHVPAEKQKAILVLIDLQRLGDPKEKLSSSQREELVQTIAMGIEKALPDLKDPKLLMQYAASLITYGMERDVNTLEYWGDNPKTQAALRPVAEAVVKTLDRAKEVASARADDIANHLSGTDDPRIAQWKAMDGLVNNAEYTKHMVMYDLALAMDANDPQRKKVAQEAIDYLKQFDNAESQVQPIVRNRMGKLQLVAGNYDQAKALFEPVANAKPEIKPAPDLSQQYEAQYFMALADVLAKKTDEAEKALTALRAWQAEHLPKDNDAAVKGADAAADMMQYRILSAEADAATDSSKKKDLNAQATKVLLALVEKQPGLSGIIYDQLLSRLPAKPDYAKLDTLMLKALLEKADAERRREGEKFDEKLIEQGAQAARELAHRPDTPGDLKDSAAILAPFFLDKLGKEAEAAEAFIDYIEKTPGKYKDIAFEYARSLIAQLRKNNPDDEASTRAYERFLPMAIDKFGKTEFAFEYAYRLQLQGKFKEAAKYFALVPKEDSRLLEAKFFQMLALKGWLDVDNKISPNQRKSTLGEIQELAGAVRAAAEKRIASAPDEKTKKNYHAMLVKTTLLAADIAKRDQNDPKKALALLNGFEQQIKGMADEDELLTRALFLRVQSYMETGQSTEAAQSLLPVLNGKDAAKGAGMVYNILKQLDEDTDKARSRHDEQAMLKLAQARATLTPFLVQWAANNKNPEIKAQTYRYKVFDADSRRRAAEMEPAGDKRTADLKAALKLYQDLQSPENFKLYQATVDKSKPHAGDPDATVQLGVGLLQYDLGNWTEAQQALGGLLDKGKLGTGTIQVTDANGQTHVQDNDPYWEARYKLIDANWHIANASQDEKMKQAVQSDLRLLYVKWGEKIGGRLYNEQFASLRQQIIPDFKMPQANGA
jgi:hypothetical protein